MTITDKYKNFLKKYKKKICERTYRRYKDKGYDDEYIFKTDLRNGNHFEKKDTIKNRHKAFIERTGLSMSYTYYWAKIKRNYTEDRIIEEGKGIIGPKKGVCRGKYGKVAKEEKVRERKFKPIIKQVLKECDDEYYLT